MKNNPTASVFAERAASDSRAQLGLRLRTLRKNKHLPITGLAKLTGVAPNTIRAIERGLPCRRISLQRIVDILNRDLEQNANGNGKSKMPERPLLNEDLDIAVLYHDAPTPLRNFIAQLLRARDYATWQGPDPKLLALAHELMQLATSQQDLFYAQVEYFRKLNSQTPSTSTSKPTKPK